MKQHKTYDKVVETLREVKPSLRKPEEFTDQIMDQLHKHQVSKRKGINISDNSGRWTIFIGFRTAMTAAAVFLIGFFIIQQWEIMSKISRLEENVNSQKQASVSLEQVENLKASYFKYFQEQQVKLKKTDLIPSKDGKEIITLNRNSLNQLLQLFEQMEAENQLLKAEIIKQFMDTSRKYPNESLKLKSL